MPKVTVLMAVYNGERYLQQAIDSILNQTFQDLEFLIINDGSSDKTWEILQSYNDARIRLVDNGENLGLTRSLNKGLEIAQGELIARQDADDISEPQRLAKQVSFLETHPEVVLVGTWHRKIDTQGNLIGERQLPCDWTQIRWELLFYCTFMHSSVMLRKSTVLQQIGFYNEAFSYAQDYEFWCRIARSLPVANLSEYLMQLRVNPSSMTFTYGSVVDEEPLQIRIANLEHLLGCNQTKMLSNGVHLNAIAALVLGYRQEVNLQELNKTIAEIFRLHSAFSQFYNLGSTEARNHKRQVCTLISCRLIDLAHFQFYQDSYAAWQLLVGASRLQWRIIFQQRTVRLVLKLLLQPGTVRAIKNIRDRQVSNLSQ